MALGILAASGQLDATALANHEFAGELSLSGELRPIRGALAMHLAGLDDASRSLVLPLASAQEAALVRGKTVYGAHHLLEVVQSLRALSGQEVATAQWQRLEPTHSWQSAHNDTDLSDIRGQTAAKRVLEVAASGGHSLLLMGSPGSGKSMLAHRLSGLLPDLTHTQALQSASVLSLAGQFEAARFGQRQTRVPHHTASAMALVGGGSTPRPGEISLAHHGVLFLDEFPEFSRMALEALREPLESGCITVSRSRGQTRFPAQFQLVAAMNPCPCGHLGSSLKACRCTPEQVQRYQSRVSGPLLDRIDLQWVVHSLPPHELIGSGREKGESTALVRDRVQRAQAFALKRQGCLNQALQATDAETQCNLDEAGTDFVRRAAQRLGWSSRATHRALKVARTLADMAGADRVSVPHLAEAIQYRRALPSAGPGA